MVNLNSSSRGIRRHLFGDGSDGDLVVSGATTIDANKNYSNLTIDAGQVLKAGDDGQHERLIIKVRGTLTINGTIRAGYNPLLQVAWNAGGAEQAGAGDGNDANGNASTFPAAGNAGGSGAGGGDGTNTGGDGYEGWQNDMQAMSAVHGGFQFRAGDTDAGVAGAAAVAIAPDVVLSLSSAPRLPGMPSKGAGGGALLTAAGSNVGGKGGDGGLGGGVLVIMARNIVWGGSGVVHSDGEVGEAGAAGVSAGVGEIGGGGGGAGGGGGGTALVGYMTESGTSTVRAAGGAAGAAGLGEENGAPRATSDGGAGGAGSAGITVYEKVL